MVGLLGYALAGGLQGYGASLVEQANAKREAAMEELRNSRLMEREDRDRSFRSSEAQKGRDFTAGQNKLTRDASGNLVTLDDGTTALQSGTSLRGLTDEKGNPRNVITKKNDTSYAIEAKRDMLIAAGWDTKRASEAAALGERPVGAVDRMKLVEDQLKTEYGKEAFTSERTRVEIRARRDELLGALDAVLDGETSRPAPAPAAATTPTQRPAPAAQGSSPGASAGAGATIGSAAQQQGLPTSVTPEQAIEQAKAAIGRGADPAQVRSRLRQMGIDPSQAGL